MKNEKNGVKKTTTRRKAVTQAIAKQENELNGTVLRHSEEIQDAIRFKAYELYVERAGNSGNDVEDWITAERIILQNIK